MSAEAAAGGEDGRERHGSASWLLRLVDVAITSGLCTLSLLLAYLSYKLLLRSIWLSEMPSETIAALVSALPVCVIGFALLRTVGNLAATQLQHSAFPREIAPYLAYLLLANLAFVREVHGAVVLNLSGVVLALLLMVRARFGRILRYLVMRRAQLLLLALSTLISLELGLRVIYLLTYSGTLEDLYDRPELPPVGAHTKLGALIQPSRNPRIVYLMKPGLDVVFQGKPMRTNEAGWREEKIPLEKPPGSRRILGLGDSLMFGWGVEEEERYMDRLAVGLNERHPETNWQSIVLAAPGYNLMMEVEVLQEIGLAYDPDLIVYGFCGNDTYLPNFIVQEKQNVFSLTSFIGLYVQLLTTAHTTALASVVDGEQAYAVQHDHQVPARYRDLVGLDSFVQALERLDRIGLERGIPVVYFSFERARPDFLPDTIHFADARSVRAEAGAAFVLSPDDPHPSALGHGLLAEELLSYLEESGLLDDLRPNDSTLLH